MAASASTGSAGAAVSALGFRTLRKVRWRLMPIVGGTPKVIAYVYGGQGTINVPSWSPDSKMLAFVSNTGVF